MVEAEDSVLRSSAKGKGKAVEQDDRYDNENLP